MSALTTGERIRNRRKQLGLTAAELGEKIGVSKSTVGRYENGQIEKIPYQVLIDIAFALKTTWGDLMGLYTEDALPVTGESGKEAASIMEHLPKEMQEEGLRYLRYLANTSDKK